MDNIATTKNIVKDTPTFNSYSMDKINKKLLCDGDSYIDGGLRKNKKFKKSTNKLPLVTVITIAYNVCSYIEDTILSILNQTYVNIEYIIIDGNSDDSTLKILQKYNEYIDYWVSERDTGIYNAMNKGLQYASGEYLIYVNAADYLHKNALENAITLRTSISYGKTFFIDDGKIIKKNYQPLNKNLEYGLGFMFPSVLIHNEVFNSIGIFNEKYKIAGDADFLIRAFNSGFKFIQREEESFSYMSIGGISDTQAENGYTEYLDALILNKNIEKNQRKYYLKKYQNKNKIKNLISKFVSIYYLKQQVYHFGIYTINFFYNYTPTFALRKFFLNKLNIFIGANTYIHTPIKLFYINNLTIGNNTTINSGAYLDNRKKITIGSNVNISHNVKIYTLGHDVNSMFFEAVGKSVIIEDYVVIFPNVLIMPGVTIMKGAVIYPGSVVTKDVDEFTIVGGNPAAKVSKRNKNLKYALDYKYWWAI